MKRKKLTPQEKKELSYQKDRRYCYGNSPHGARKSVPSRKRSRNRANRRFVNLLWATIKGYVEVEHYDTVDSQTKHKTPNNWQKCPDESLKDNIARKNNRR